MRFGVAGVGRIGVLHAENLAGVVGADSVLVADVDAARATAVAEKLGTHAVPDVDALLAAGLAGLVVAVNTDGHADLILRAVRAGVPVFCEKPVAPDIAGTRAVLDRLRGSDVPVQIGFQRRFDVGYAAARAAVAAGSLGRLHTVLGFTLDPEPPPPAYIPGSGGIFRDCAVHDLDILRWVTGQEVVEVYATGSNLGADYIREAGDVDAVAVTLTLADGTLAQLSASRYNRAGYDVRMELRGHDDSIVVGLDPRTPLRSVQPDGPAGGAAYPGFLDRFRDAYAAEIAAFVRLATERANSEQHSSPCTVSDALAAFVLAEACELSRRQHRPVTVAEVSS
jgi:myo-inositol 2-dehydrogenase/D-chiro-inositol 1-dehydrogenase